ncbi:hypothetical protein ACOMHN_067585 [Nucella lapillus]
MSMMRARVQGHRWVDHPAAVVMKARVPGQWVDRPAAVVMEAREQGCCGIDHPAVADNRRNSYLPLCSLRTTVATVSSPRLTGSEADKLGRPPGGLPKLGLLPAGLSSLWDGQHHFPAQGQDDVLPLRTATMQRQTLATLQEFSLGGYGGSLTSDVCRFEGSSCQLAAVATPAILSNEISLTCYSREPRDP